MAGIRLGSGESARAFKGIICDDISEFESYMPSHAVGSLWRVYPVHGLCEQRQSRASIPAEILAYARATPAELARSRIPAMETSRV
jgi:hypothetical protein